VVAYCQNTWQGSELRELPLLLGGKLDVITHDAASPRRWMDPGPTPWTGDTHRWQNFPSTSTERTPPRLTTTASWLPDWMSAYNRTSNRMNRTNKKQKKIIYTINTTPTSPLRFKTKQITLN
jgi:hypothetical protein